MGYHLPSWRFIPQIFCNLFLSLGGSGRIPRQSVSLQFSGSYNSLINITERGPIDQGLPIQRVNIFFPSKLLAHCMGNPYLWRGNRRWYIHCSGSQVTVALIFGYVELYLSKQFCTPSCKMSKKLSLP